MAHATHSLLPTVALPPHFPSPSLLPSFSDLVEVGGAVGECGEVSSGLALVAGGAALALRLLPVLPDHLLTVVVVIIVVTHVVVGVCEEEGEERDERGRREAGVARVQVGDGEQV